jgi:hypothetical protein
MTPETEAFLALVRHAEEPTQEDEQRVLRGVQASVAAGLTTSVAVRAWRSDTWLATAGKALVSTVAKLSLVAIGTAVGVRGELSPALSQPVTRSVAHAPTSAPPPATSALPPAGSALPQVALVLSPRSAPSARVPSSPHPAASATASSVPRRLPSEPVASLRAELNVLDRAQRALKNGDGEAALRELDNAKTSDGPLRAERQAARILALCSAGRASEARAAIARFFEDYPDSAHRAAIVSGCANFATD